MAIFEIPLTANSQKFSIALAGNTYNIAVVWRDAIMAGWVLDINDIDNVPLVCGIPLVTGVDLLAQYAYLGIGGALIVTTDGDFYAPATSTNLGTGSHLWFVTGGLPVWPMPTVIPLGGNAPLDQFVISGNQLA